MCVCVCVCEREREREREKERNFLDKPIGIQLSGKSSAKDLMYVGGR